jgi:hypothetical protein
MLTGAVAAGLATLVALTARPDRVPRQPVPDQSLEPVASDTGLAPEALAGPAAANATPNGPLASVSAHRDPGQEATIAVA